MVVPASFFLFPGTFYGKRFVGPSCSPRGPLGRAYAKARESYSYTAAKSSRFRDLPHCEIKRGPGRSPLADCSE